MRQKQHVRLSTASFISLGPACFTAGVLKHGGLRNCSFPLDWARSGGHLLPDLLTLGAEHFYYKYIHQPSIHYDLSELPSTKNNFTAGLKQVETKYGFPYFYNPHRIPGSGKDYFLRCLNRFHDAITNLTVITHFLIIDQPSNIGEKYFDEPLVCLRYIDETLRRHLSPSKQFTVSLARVVKSSNLLSSSNIAVVSKSMRNLEIFVPSQLDEETIAPIVCRLIYGRDFRVLPLYTPLSYQPSDLETA